ncbi:unnamed protein product [Penicillium discolor]
MASVISAPHRDAAAPVAHERDLRAVDPEILHEVPTQRRHDTALARDPEVAAGGVVGRDLLPEARILGGLPEEVLPLDVGDADLVPGIVVAQVLEHRGDEAEPVRLSGVTRQPVHVHPRRNVDREDVRGRRHLDERRAPEVARGVLQDAGDGGGRGLIPDEDHRGRRSRRVFRPAVRDDAPTRADQPQLLTHCGSARPPRGRTGEPRLQVQHEVDVDLGAAVVGDPQVTDGVGAHRAALLLRDGQSYVDRSILASTPDAGGKTSFTRLSYTSPGVPSSLSSSPPRVTRTNEGETRETARTSARVRM